MAVAHAHHDWHAHQDWAAAPPGPPQLGFRAHGVEESELLAVAEYLAPGRTTGTGHEAVDALREFADHDAALLRRTWAVAARECRRGLTRRAAVDLLWEALLPEDAA
jgi:hypothetical protein